jgi:hypothetical protein
VDPLGDVTYRGFTLNDSAIEENVTGGDGAGTGIVGSVIDTFDFSDVDLVQYMEKRSQQDGMDAGQPFQGARRIRIAGTLYDLSRALLFDRLADLRSALNAVLAYREDPESLGYLPLYFSVPTNRVEDYFDGEIALRVLAMPRALSHQTDRDQLGGEELDALAIPYQATLICKDPSIMAALPQEYSLSAGGTVSGTLSNRGNFICPVNIILLVGAAAGTVACTIGDTVFTISVPASSGNRIIRYKGEDKVMTLEEDSVETLRMDLLTSSGDTTWTTVDPGSSAYSVVFTTVTPQAGSKFWFYERYA